MKNILKIVIACLILSVFHAYSQESSETVDLGFGIVQNSNISTVSSGTVNSNVLGQRDAINVNDALYGRLLGLTAMQRSGSGWVGDQNFGAVYNIRGIETLTGENGVLVLVDGFPRNIDRLTLDEIESVTVLKDAAAVALYGYRGINGVINVKTRRAPAAIGLQVNANYRHKFTFLPPMPQYANAYTFAQAMNEARRNDGLSNSYNQFEIDAFKNGGFSFLYPDIDWRKESLRDVGSENVFSLNVSNRTERVGFFTMLNYTNSHGLFKGTEDNKEAGGYSTQLKYSKANVRMNLDVVLREGTKFEANVLGSLFETNSPSGISASQMFSTLNYLPAGAFPIKTVDNSWGGRFNYNNWGIYNPVARIKDSGYYREIGAILSTDFKLTQDLGDLVEGLSITGRFGYDAYNIAFERRNKGYSWAWDRFAFDSEGNPGSIIREEVYESNQRLTFSRGNVTTSRSMNFVGSIDYQKQLDNHNMTGSLIYYFNNSVNKERFNTFYRQSIMGYFHYDFQSKYVADFVLTYAGSNRSFPQVWALSPTLSLGWILTEEDFLLGNNIISFAKLRGSYGMLHSDNVPRNGSIWMSIYDWGSGSFPLTNPTGGLSGYGGRMQSILPTTDFKLEKAHKFNLGIDAVLINSIGVTFEAYYQRRTNIIQQETGLFSAMTGVGAGFGNHGIVDSKGIEIGLSYTERFGDLLVNFGGMLTYSVNKVIDCVEEPKAYPWLEIKGKAVNQPRGLEFLGFFRNEQDILDSPHQEFSMVRPGDAKYKRQNKEAGDRSVNDFDRVPIGYSINFPLINYAFNAALEFKGIGASILFQGARQFNAWDTRFNQGLFPLVLGVNIDQDYYDNRWIPGLGNADAKYPKLTTSDNPNNNTASTLWLRDASFLKLRHVELYYRLPESVLRNIKAGGNHLGDLKISVRGENLYTWTPFNGIDPERLAYTYPTLRGVSVGLSVTF